MSKQIARYAEILCARGYHAPKTNAENRGALKLTLDQINAIRMSDATAESLAATMKVHPNTIWRYRNK